MKNLLYLFNEHLLIKNLFTKNLFTFLVLIVFLLPHYACNTTEPPINEYTLTLKLEDVSCTEAWLQLTTPNIQIPNTITLYINNQPKETINLNTADTLLYVDSLLPNQTYKIIAAMQQSNNASNEISITTMDTTSHNFTWQTFTFGNASAGSSVLYDVAIIDENDIWAVGEIYMNDSLGNPDPTFYNAAHWDGQSWQLKRILYKGGIWTIRAIFAFNENDIWFSGYVRYLNGKFIELPIPDVLIGWGINKLWGSSSNDLYAVGNNGNIAHYNGSSWTKIESGTILNINDIWGDYNEKTQEWEILAVAANVNSSVERAIIKISDNTSQIISSSPIQWSLRTCWFIPPKKYYIAGSGIYEKHNLMIDQWANEPLEITTYYTNRIRGNDINDVIGVGAFGDLVHFNGWKWKADYTEPALNFGSYLSVDFKNNIVVAVGLEYNQAVILIGVR